MRWWLALVAVGCGGTGGSSPSDAEDSGGPPAEPNWPAEWVAVEDEVLRLVNAARALGATCGSQPMAGGQTALESDRVLRDLARAHSEDMSTRDFFDHVNPDGDDPVARMTDAAFAGAQPWGENIAFGPPDGQSVFDLWMGSPPHCENIMEPAYGVIGIGMFGGPSGPYWTQDFAGSH